MENPWNFKRADWKEGKPLGKSSYDFLAENTEWVLYVRRDLRFPCVTCFDQASQSRTQVYCESCWSTGYKVRPQIVPSRIVRGDGAVRSREGDLRLLPGMVEEYQVIAIFPRIVCPELGDLVLICEWDKPTYDIGENCKPKPVHINSVNQIRQINTQFERQVGWFSCGMKDFDIDLIGVIRSARNSQSIEMITADTTWDTNNFWA